MSEKLKSCPFCGSEAIRIEDKFFLDPEHPIGSFCICDECHSQIALCNNRDEAVNVWNHRAERIAKVEVNKHPCGISGKCGACGEKVYNEEPYCSHCGARLEWDE